MSFSPSEQKPEAEREEGLLDIGSKCSTVSVIYRGAVYTL